jgi:VanZ family protein
MNSIKYQRPALLWTLIILILCSISFGSIGESSLFFAGFDKLVHCGLFFVLTVFISYGFIRQNGQGRFTFINGVLIGLIAIAYGGIIELLQLFVFTWRGHEWSDLFADSVGAGMAVFSAWLILNASEYEKI